MFSNSLLGMPDAGFISLTETEFLTNRMAAVSATPLLVDIDTGYGNAINVFHAVRVMERSGAAAILVEDQVAPKRSGYMGGKQLVSVEEMCGKVSAATEARISDDFVIIARTDAHGVEGVSAAIDRANAYVDAGADCVFVEGLHSLGDLERIGAEIDCPWKMTNLSYMRAKDTAATPTPDFQTKPDIGIQQLGEMGFSMAITGTQPLRFSALALVEHYQRLFEDPMAEVIAVGERLHGSVLEDWHAFSGFAEIEKLERRFLPQDEATRRHTARQPGYYARGENRSG
jgi:2-methylisocitrate lyase-like PEP mutase family enzyme